MATEIDKRNASFLENAGKSAKALATGAAKVLTAPGRALAGAIEANKDKKVKAKADAIAAKNAGKTATQADIISHDLYDPQGNLIAKKGDPKGTDRRNQVEKTADEAAKAQAAAKIDERFGTDIAEKQSAPVATSQSHIDRIRQGTASEDDLRKAFAEGYVGGPKTQEAYKALGLTKSDNTETKTEPQPETTPAIEPEDQKEVTNAVEESKTPNEAADKVAEAIGADKEQKKQIKEATKSIWSAIADHSISKESGGYFLMDALMKQANNAKRRDSNYIENLSRAAHGDTILGYDISNDEKSKWETMVQDPALERANTAAGIESESNAQTAADLGTANQEQQYGEAVGPQGLAQTAATKSALGGNFDQMANAYASGDQEEIQKSLDAALKDPQIDSTIKSLQAQLQQGTLDADIKAAELANSLTSQQLSLMSSQAKLLGIEGDLKGAMKNAINNLASGNIDIQSIMMLMMMSKFGVM